MPTHHGFYQSIGRFAYPIYCKELWEHQVRRGFTTSVIYQPPPDLFDIHNKYHAFAMMVEMMLDAGILTPDCPALTISPAPMARGAMYYATQPWPELVLHTIDDPVSEDQLGHVLEDVARARDLGFRCGTHINNPHLFSTKLGDAMDIWFPSANSWQGVTHAHAEEREKEVHACYHWDLSDEPLYARLLTGTWCWVRGVRSLLLWSFVHEGTTRITPGGNFRGKKHDGHFYYSYGYPTPQGPPRVTPGYDGLSEGIRDCRALEWAEETEDEGSIELRAAIPEMHPGRFSTPGETFPIKDENDKFPFFAEELWAQLDALHERMVRETS